MRLKKLIITGYRSIKKEETVLLDEKVTILIGANDHGKTNILSAIQCLNDEKQITSDDKNWDLSTENAVKIEWRFLPTDEVLQKLDSLKIESAEGQPDNNANFPLNETGEIVFYRDGVNNAVKVESLPKPVPSSKEAEILQLRPRVELFEAPVANLVDQVSLAQLEKPEFEFMQGVFRHAGIWDNRAEIFTQNDQTSKILNEASGRLTTVLNDKWNQGRDLKWKFEHTGTNGDQIAIRIEDPAITNRFTRPSLRSSGFRTYFLLSMMTHARTQNKPGNSYLFLFDEPGTYLHPHAQLDLQRSFESMADKTQIVYSTHSLFLINKNYPERNRVISKTKKGTKIDQKPFTKNWKSVRESLGILLSNNFLIAEKTLLTEGPSDIIYILDTVKKLKSLGQIDIDLNDFSVVDAGTSENYLAMAKLMLSEGRDIVALLDGDKGGKDIETQLKKVCEVECKNKKLQIIRLPADKSSEDIFSDIEILRKAIKKVYGNLVENGARKFKDGLNIDDELLKIQTVSGKTLGQTLDQVTSVLFDDGDKISKLSIALEYETMRQNEDGNLPNEAPGEIEKIKKFLGLRGEKSVESGVFEEVE